MTLNGRPVDAASTAGIDGKQEYSPHYVEYIPRLPGVDGRTSQARRYAALFRQFLRETGGRHVELCRQAATLVAQRELLDAAVARGEMIDSDLLIRLCGTINRTLRRLRAARRGVDTEAEREALRKDALLPARAVA